MEAQPDLHARVPVLRIRRAWAFPENVQPLTTFRGRRRNGTQTAVVARQRKSELADTGLSGLEQARGKCGQHLLCDLPAEPDPKRFLVAGVDKAMNAK